MNIIYLNYVCECAIIVGLFVGTMDEDLLRYLYIGHDYLSHKSTMLFMMMTMKINMMMILYFT